MIVQGGFARISSLSCAGCVSAGLVCRGCRQGVWRQFPLLLKNAPYVCFFNNLDKNYEIGIDRQHIDEMLSDGVIAQSNEESN